MVPAAIGCAPAETPSGELVVLALPYDAVAGAIDQHKDALAGKVVVDITNPADWSTMDRVVTPAGSSAVVKAFNTTFAGTLVAGQAAGQTLDVLIASDDEQAKQKVASLVEGGLRPIDVGPLKPARQLEQVGLPAHRHPGPARIRIRQRTETALVRNPCSRAERADQDAKKPPVAHGVRASNRRPGVQHADGRAPAEGA